MVSVFDNPQSQQEREQREAAKHEREGAIRRQKYLAFRRPMTARSLPKVVPSAVMPATPLEHSQPEHPPVTSPTENPTLSEPSAPVSEWELLIAQAFTALVEELRSNWRVAHPTKQEQVLEVFQKHGQQLITLEELMPIFADAEAPERQASNLLMVQLNKKLKRYGLRIESHTAYRLVPAHDAAPETTPSL